MKKYTSLIIGHICKDKNTDHLGNTVYAAGGAVLYSSAAAYALGHHVGVVTKVSPCDRELLDSFTLPMEDVYCAFSGSTTLMENTYFTSDKERRRSVCASQGEEIRACDIPETLGASVYHLAGLVKGDYEKDMIKKLALRGKVAVDVQGYLRNVDHDKGGTMYFADWEDKRELLPFISFLKTDAAEAEILTGTSEPEKAARILADWGAKEVLITHNSGVVLFAGGSILTCPIKARNLSGRTGRGDTTFASYINERLFCSPEEALLTAAATVSLKMENPGPFTGNKKDVTDYIKEFYL